MGRGKSLAAIANERVPFAAACAWAGIGAGERDRGMKVTCPACGESGALRVYPGHAWCFSERRYFTPVALLAEVWEMDREEAAVKALDKIGYVPAGYAAAFENARRPPEPEREHLATALRIFCERSCPDWKTRQYDAAVAGLLARCLGLLPQVRTAEDSDRWLAACKTVMGRVLNSSNVP
jgi:hypothetical protein